MVHNKKYNFKDTIMRETYTILRWKPFSSVAANRRSLNVSSSGYSVFTDGKLPAPASTLRTTVSLGYRLAKPPGGNDEQPVNSFAPKRLLNFNRSSRVHSGSCWPHNICLTSSGVNAFNFSFENTRQKPAFSASICLLIPFSNIKSVNKLTYCSTLSMLTSWLRPSSTKLIKMMVSKSCSNSGFLDALCQFDHTEIPKLTSLNLLKVLGMAMIMEDQLNDYLEELLLGTCQGTKNVLRLYHNMVNLEIYYTYKDLFAETQQQLMNKIPMWDLIHCLPHASIFSPRGIRTRSCFKRPTLYSSSRLSGRLEPVRCRSTFSR
ncbi:hypothetical protein AGLY_000324 [Aphis glycines]|uniref:Uncharacterized protein n=1 Tax=Aphis glycines TaxID=307491 RepID=A0A6G0U921_APHGL|nr:hypothetical protein AGLY_000324 [Aphis glycines]